MTNFDFLKNEEKFDSFAETAVTAEKLLNIDIDSCVLNCRRAMEFAVKWMYSVDKELKPPYEQTLVCLINDENFRDIMGEDTYRRMEFIRKVGNNAAHSGKKVTKEQAELCLENLYYFMDQVAYFYADSYTEQQFDKNLPIQTPEKAFSPANDTDIDLQALIEENKALKKQLTAHRQEKQQTYTSKPLEHSEADTRKIYIDFMLQDTGWTEGKDWQNEVKLDGMPNKSGIGYADYVLYGDDGKALAVLEAKKTCTDVAKGRQQAKLYADILEKKYGRRPIIFLSNGFDTRIQDNLYPERKVASVYSKRDLEKLFNLQSMRKSLDNINVNQKIAGRYYQVGAIRAVCDDFGRKNRRKALLVMATGSGKTRTIIALCDVLLRHGWIKNILFLADRNALVTQAKRNFVNLLPDLSVTNLCEEKDNYNAHCVFSTYQTMMNVIDTAKDNDGKLFTVGHFDLVVCDEAHRSIYNKYRDIFNYFDAPLVGLTATPKSDIDKNTYEVFELQDGTPTYGYELAQAVKDGYLVDFISAETKLNFIENGIVYDELSDEEKKIYEDTFRDEDGNIPKSIVPSALNEWIFNKDTILHVLHTLMEKGLKIDYGEKLGKTIIFARNHNHAEKILEIFNKEYPYLPDFAKVIDNYTTYSQSAVDEFSDPKKMPQIAISVDMLDTGIDIPEILNLVFFKRVMSKAKFWQMIGRGTRLCPHLLDGEDKKQFYIFDFCGNFEFFRMNKDKTSANIIALQGAIFHLKSQIVFKLQNSAYRTEELISFRQKLIDDMVKKVQELNKENFAVRQHLRYVEKYSDPQNYQLLTYEDTLLIGQELAPLILPDNDDVKAVRFDALMYGVELAYLTGKKYGKYRSDFFKKVNAVASVSNIPEIKAQNELITKILHNGYFDNASISDFEYIRENLRNLIKYIPVSHMIYDTNFSDDILSIEWNPAELENDDLKNYKAKMEFYIRQHQDNAVIGKLKSNLPLNSDDIKSLEEILWSEVGSKENYEAEYGKKPLGELVREIVGMDMNAAKEAFSKYLNNANLDSRQIYFINQIVEYIVQNGLMKDLSVLQEPPFINQGSIVEIFTDISMWKDILKIIEKVNTNALVA